MTHAPHHAEERREFYRIDFGGPVRFQSYSVNKFHDSVNRSEVCEGRAFNISLSGILFQTDHTPPPISSILWISVDLRTLKICRDIEHNALVHGHGILGKVVRLEEDPLHNGHYDIGVCFLTEKHRQSAEVQKILSDITQSA